MTYKTVGTIALLLILLVLGGWNVHTTVSIERGFNAPAADVWRVWTDAYSIQRWWGPKGYTAVVLRNDLRPGGSYLWGMRSDRGKMFWNTGTYREVIANKEMLSTMSFANESGTAIPASQVSVPGRWPDEITVLVQLSESARKTRVVVTEAGVPLIAYALTKIGWDQQFDKIQALL